MPAEHTSQFRFFRSRVTLVLLFVHSFVHQLAYADVSLPKIFGDHMVLQRDAKVPIWGWAEAGEKVTVEFAGQSAQVVTGTDRSWRVDLDRVPADNQGRALTIRGNNVLKFDDVVVGDVWFASGQSNMEFGLQIADGGNEAIAKADDQLLRLFLVPYATSLVPRTDLADSPADALEGKWQVCSPKVLAAKWGSNGFSAIGYFYGREMRSTTGSPVGIIGCYKGGSAAQPWISMDGLKREPRLVEFVERHQQWKDGFAEAAKAYPTKQAAYDAEMQKWEKEIRPTFEADLLAWNAALTSATAGSPPPPKPVPSRPRPQRPIPPDGGAFGPGNLFNGMVAPIIPYTIKGIIWYQGESNTSNLAQAVQYEILFRRLITDWREKWGAGNLPFLYVQLAGYKATTDPALVNWAWLRESQAKAMQEVNTVMASAVDLSDPFDAHPKNKTHLSQRLALAARKVAYGEGVVAAGPTYASVKERGGELVLTFTDQGSGLVVSGPPWRAMGSNVRDMTRVTGFLIAGADKKFVQASARVEGDTVVVSSESIAQPVAVRYNWADLPDGNLYNREGLPAAPFRTDAWEPAPLENTALRPAAGDAAWQEKFKERVAQTRGRRIDLVFDGDSITDRFQTNGKNVWEKEYAGRSAANVGLEGDATSQVLYRLNAGQMKDLDPKLVVLLIGMNNAQTNSAEQIAEAIMACANGYVKQCPNAHVLLLGPFPRRTPSDPVRAKLEQVNGILARASIGERVMYRDIGSEYLDANGLVRAELMPGLIHPSAKGYEVWAEAIRPVVDRYCPPPMRSAE